MVLTAAAEARRLATLQDYGILDTPPEQGFDDLTRLAATACQAPIAAVSLVDADRQWFKSSIGLDSPETPRSASFCQFAMLGHDVMVVPDALEDPRFADNALVVGRPGIRFYAGTPLVSSDGQPLGALCVIDTAPRPLTDEQAGALALLGRQVSAQLELHRSIRHLEVSEARYRTLFERAPIGMVVVEGRPGRLGALVECNAEFASMLGLGAGAPARGNFLDLVHPDDVDAAAALLTAIADGTDTDARLRCRFRSPDGGVVLALVAVAGIDGRQVPGGRIVVQVEDVTAATRSSEALTYLGSHDPLTGLANRARVLERLREVQRRAVVGSPVYVGVLFVDLDRFKVINDSLGHDAGDTVLTTVAQRIQGVIRDGDLAARVGADEFVVLCDRLGATAVLARRRAEAVAQRIKQAVSTPVALEHSEVFVAASVGIALGPSDGQSPEDLLRDADAAMDAAKDRGRGRTELFDTGLRARSVQRQTLESGLHRAIERGELELHYQPTVDLRTGRPVGAEALLRWRHPERGLLAPDAFIAVAEETGLIVPIGAWALGRACRDLAAERSSTGWNLAVAVNVSARQLDDAGLATAVGDALAVTGLPPSALDLEVTETALLDLTGPARTQLELLRRQGVGLGIDDFGTGYASLTYLKDLPVDFVKIDRSFVDGLGENRSQTAIVAAVLSLADSLGLRVVAEGVETTSQAEQLAAMGCGYGQGYLWSRPRPREQVMLLSPELFGPIRR